jgi:hypothetical protein
MFDYYDARLLLDVLLSADTHGTLGTCDDWRDGEYCRLCTALENLQSLMFELREEEVEPEW